MTVPADTIPAALAAATHRGAGRWRSVGMRARRVALGLAEAGLPSGGIVSVDGPPGDDRVVAELAVLAAGGATGDDDPWRRLDATTDLAELEEKGAAADGECPDRFEDMIGSVTQDDLATVADGHRLTHRNILWATRSLVRWLDATPADRILVSADPADVGTRLTGIYLATVLGAGLSHDRTDDGRPTIVFADAAFWTALADRVTAALPDRALRLARAAVAGDPLSTVERLRARRLARARAAAMAAVGIDQTRAFVCLGPLPSDGVRRELLAAGVEVVATWGHPGVAGLGAAGNPPCPLPGVTIGVDDDGTLAVRAASAAVDPGGDGWLRTGQQGTLDERGAVRT